MSSRALDVSAGLMHYCVSIISVQAMRHFGEHSWCIHVIWFHVFSEQAFSICHFALQVSQHQRPTLAAQATLTRVKVQNGPTQIHFKEIELIFVSPKVTGESSFNKQFDPFFFSLSLASWMALVTKANTPTRICLGQLILSLFSCQTRGHKGCN